MNYRKLSGPVLALLLVCGPGITRAQSVAQLLEQLILDKAKLSHMKATLQSMYDGYRILDEGYSQIRDIAKGNFNLHKTFLDKLMAVSPTVRNYYKVAAIAADQQAITIAWRQAERHWQNTGLFAPSELGYIHQLYQRLDTRMTEAGDRLSMIMKDGNLRMSDAQRLQAIDGIDDEMKSLRAGLTRFNDQVALQALQRGHERNNIQSIQKIYHDLP